MRINTLYRILTAVAVGLLILASCRPELEYVENSFHSGSATLSGNGETLTVLFDSNAGSASLNITASGTWTAEFVNGRAYWCKLSQTEGSRGTAALTISVESNGEYDERGASILFTCGDVKKTIVVTQKQHDAMLLTSGRMEMSADGGVLVVEMMTNVDFTSKIEADGSAWIHELSSKGLSKATVSFAIDANPSLDRRSGTITFSGVAGEETVTVYQRGETPTIVISEESLSIPAEEGIFKVEVASNLDVSIRMPEDCDWLREVITKTISTNTYTFEFERNHTREPRRCELVFENDAFSRAETVYVEQQKAPILLSDELQFVQSAGDVVALILSDAVTGFDQIQFHSDWPEPAGMEADSAGRRFLFRVGPNPENSIRTAECSIFRPGFDKPDRVTFVQFGGWPSFSYVVNAREVSAPEIKGAESALIIWGDGSCDFYDESLVHRYEKDGPHTIRIEGAQFPFFLIHSPQNGMTFDLSKMGLN